MAYRGVGEPAAMERLGLFVLEGRLVVRRAIESGVRPESLLVTPAALDALADLQPEHLPFPVYVATPEALNGVTGFNFHRGCVALARRPAALPSLDSLLHSPCLLALEGVGNPDNIGGLFRTASALGAGGVLLDRTSGDPLYRKAVRTSMGAVLRVPWTRVDGWSEAFDTVRRAGFTIVALTPSADAMPIERAPRPGRVVLLLGAEGPGLLAQTLALADLRVRIPIDPQADSLNVVVAAGIALQRLAPA
ncbi:MAG TPA: RNA methyltransferase [Vicinamibacterales bacterium]|nr:RNA methyltransferase [Vicinamibacterales bacterium]